jgi:hypothetical protein
MKRFFLVSLVLVVLFVAAKGTAIELRKRHHSECKQELGYTQARAEQLQQEDKLMEAVINLAACVDGKKSILEKLLGY